MLKIPYGQLSILGLLMGIQNYAIFFTEWKLIKNMD